MAFVQISVCVITIAATTAAQILSLGPNTINVSTNGILGPVIGNNLVITSNIPGVNNVDCVAGNANNVHLSDVCNAICNCCGCINSTSCQNHCLIYLSMTYSTLGSGVGCNIFWPTIFDSKAGNFTCPNQNDPFGNVKACQLGYNCCDRPYDETKIQDCSKSAMWSEICSTC